MRRSSAVLCFMLLWFSCCANNWAQQASLTSQPLTGVRYQSRGPARIESSAEGLHLTMDDPRHDAALLVLPPTDADTLDLSAWQTLAVDITNLAHDRQQRLVLTATEKEGANHPHKVTVGIGLNPGETRTLRLLLPHAWLYAAPDGMPGPRVLDTAHIARLEFELQWPFERAHAGLVDVRLSRLRVEGRITATKNFSAANYAPFIDRYGQFMHAEWPEKIHSDSALRTAFVRENAALRSTQRPASWDRFGGWKNGPQRKATGSFRTEKFNGKWYLVDPDGHLFFSQGIDVLTASNETIKVPESKANWFEKLPEGAHSYNAIDHNLRIKYASPDYEQAYFEQLTKRLEAWGINTIGDWSALELMHVGRTPYTLQLTDYDGHMPQIAGSKLKFYDVFDPRYEEKMRTLLQRAAERKPIVAHSLTDPMCIGYFIDNELNFGNRDKLVLVDEILQSPASQAAKQAFIHDLEAKYKQIENLNAAWQTHHATWESLLQSTQVPASAAYADDAQAFFRHVVDQYFRLARNAVKTMAPNRLYLGARFISTDAVRPALYEACARSCDVLSVNIYAHSAAGFPEDDFPDMPVLITEFQFGVLQRGIFSPSLCQAGATPQERGLAYTRFVEGALRHSKIVGTHWFQYRDQPLTGRGDGEAYQIGFIDVTDTPYSEMTEASRAIADRMYASARSE